MGEEIACVSGYRGSWETCAPQDCTPVSELVTYSHFQLSNTFLHPPGRTKFVLAIILCTAIGIHKPFLLHYCFQRKFIANSNFVLKAICFLAFLLYKLTLSHNPIHSVEPALTSLLLQPGLLSGATWQHRARDRFPEDLVTNITL